MPKTVGNLTSMIRINLISVELSIKSLMTLVDTVCLGIWASTQHSVRRACAYRQISHFSHTQSIEVEESSDQNICIYFPCQQHSPG